VNASIGATGFAHIVFAGVSSVTSLLAILLIGHWLSSAANLNWLWRVSVQAAVVVAATGIVTAIAVADRHALAGLAERLTIGAFLHVDWPTAIRQLGLPPTMLTRSQGFCLIAEAHL
jgi:hypothetical protein